MKRLNGAGARALEIIKQFTVAQRTIAIIGVAVLRARRRRARQPARQADLRRPLLEHLGLRGVRRRRAADKDKVEYQLQGTGTILVPQTAVDSERLATASLLSSGAGGYSLLDNLGVTASEFQQNVTYKRAIEGELAKTIEAIDGVSSASVQLAIPQQTVFTDQQQDPTASVFVNVSQPLTTDQVDAIVHLVAAAYPGLTTDNVSVVDQKGDTLSSVGSGTAGSGVRRGRQPTRRRRSRPCRRCSTRSSARATRSSRSPRTSPARAARSRARPTAPRTRRLSGVVEGRRHRQRHVRHATGASGVLGTDTTNAHDRHLRHDRLGHRHELRLRHGARVGQEQRRQQDDRQPDDRARHAEPADDRRRAELARSPGKISTSQLQTMVTNAAGVNAARGDTVSVTHRAVLERRREGGGDRPRAVAGGAERRPDDRHHHDRDQGRRRPRAVRAPRRPAPQAVQAPGGRPRSTPAR